MDRPPHSGPPATSGKTPGTSLSQMIWLPKILTRNLSLTWGQDVEARNVLSEGHGHIGLPLSPLPGRCCAWNPSHIFGLSPGDWPVPPLWKITTTSPPSFAYSFQKETRCRASFSQPSPANLRSVLLEIRHSRQAMDKKNHEGASFSTWGETLQLAAGEAQLAARRALLRSIVTCMAEKSNHLKWF